MLVNTKKLIIDESKWGRGKGMGFLLKSDGKMCCLGFVCKSALIEDEKMLWRTMPSKLEDSETSKLLNNQYGWLFSFSGDSNSFDADRLANINDSHLIPDASRKQQIKAIFQKHNIEVVFINSDTPTNEGSNE